MEMSWLGFMQWPALIVTVLAAWRVSLKQKNQRRSGFWLFLVSNVLWVIWGIHAQAYAVIALQACLSVSNIHGIISNRKKPSDQSAADEQPETDEQAGARKQLDQSESGVYNKASNA